MQSHFLGLFAVCRVLFFGGFLRSAISYFRLFAMQSHCFLVVCGLQSLIFWWFLRIAYKASFFGGFAVICLGHILLGSFWLDLCPRSDPTTFRLQQRP